MAPLQWPMQNMFQVPNARVIDVYKRQVFATLTISSNDTNDSAYYEDLIRNGSIQPLPDDLSAWPNLEKLMNQLDYTRYSDGHFYAIPRISFVDLTLACSDAAMIVRRDWMENLGLDDPTNIDEFIDLVAAFANDDPDVYKRQICRSSPQCRTNQSLSC